MIEDDTLERGDEGQWPPYVGENMWQAGTLVTPEDLRTMADRLERLIKDDYFTIKDNGSGYGEARPALVFKAVDTMRKAAYQMEMKL